MSLVRPNATHENDVLGVDLLLPIIAHFLHLGKLPKLMPVVKNLPKNNVSL